jgi:pimeloyl-ACP methyl ester carboxylesterase
MTDATGPDGADQAANSEPPVADLAVQEQPLAGPFVAQPVDPALESAVERDLRRGRRLATLSWLLAAGHATLALVAVQQSAMLVDVDRKLITTSAIEQVGANFGLLRLALVVLLAIVLVLAIRWVRGAVPTLEALERLRVVEPSGAGTAGVAGPGAAAPPAPPERTAGLRRLGILLRPAGVPSDQASWSEVRVGSGRPLAIATAAATLIAFGVGIVAAVGMAMIGDPATARAMRVLAGFDGALWLVATILAGALAADIAWRVAVAGRAVGIFAPLSDAPGRLILRLVPALLLFGGLLPIAATSHAAEITRCPSSTLECAAVAVPIDHFGSSAQQAISVVYGVHRASGVPHGTLVVAVGGPGASGLESADGILDGFDDELVAAYDILFWDQRGIGRSDGHDCPIAGGIYSGVDTSAETARAFVDACLNEADTGSTGLQRYATSQAAEDLEAIRDRLGFDRFVLYGESYGTELAQIYAAAHPNRLSGLILDGAVDLTLTANDFWATAAKTFDKVLTATFDGCRSDDRCQEDVADPAETYDILLSVLDNGPITVSYGDLDGIVRPHTFNRNDVVAATGVIIYEPAGRSLLQRAIAATAHSDHVPMARLAELFGPGISPVSTFAYHAIMCADYRVSPTLNTSDYSAVIARGHTSGALAARLRNVYYAQVPCLYWPDQPGSSSRPAPLTDLPAPVLVLAATLDPITSVEFGRAIAQRAVNGYLIETSGGPHVTFGRGDACPDRPILRFLLEGQLPASRTVYCAGEVADPYIPLTSLDASGFTDALDAMSSVESELTADALYTFWGGEGVISLGCRFGGTVTLTAGDARDDFTFNGCEYARGMPLEGTGRYEVDSDALTLNVTFPDGSLEYTSGASRAAHGTFRGKEVTERD